jgi:hypothetical protein
MHSPIVPEICRNLSRNYSSSISRRTIVLIEEYDKKKFRFGNPYTLLPTRAAGWLLLSTAKSTFMSEFHAPGIDDKSVWLLHQTNREREREREREIERERERGNEFCICSTLQGKWRSPKIGERVCRKQEDESRASFDTMFSLFKH